MTGWLSHSSGLRQAMPVFQHFIVHVNEYVIAILHAVFSFEDNIYIIRP